MKTLFDVSDSVILKETGEVGKIKSIISYIGDGCNIYEVEFDSRVSLYMEKYLEFEEKNDFSKDRNEVGIDKKIKDKIRELVNDLALVKGKSEKDTLSNACKVQIFLAQRDNNEIIDICFDTLKYWTLYEGLCGSEDNYIVDCLVFKEILRYVGAEVINVAMRDQNGFIYINSLLLLGDKYYYFDCNLERNLYFESKKKKKDILVAAGLGTNSYREYYDVFKAVDLLNNNFCELPSNIANEDYDRKKIEKIKREI